MATYLIGMLYHEPDMWALYQKSVIEDYESSTGIFIDAPSPEAAIAWGEIVAEALLRKANTDETLDWKALGYWCWIEKNPQDSNWKHCLSFFQNIKAGEWPSLEAMITSAYIQWAKNNGIEYT